MIPPSISPASVSAMSPSKYIVDTNEDSQEYDFLTMSVPVVSVSFEELLFGPDSLTEFLPLPKESPIDYSSIDPIPYVPENGSQLIVHSTNPICGRSEFQDFKHETDLSCTMPYAAHDTQLAHELLSRIARDYANIQCESESVRGILLSTYANPYTNLFDVAVQEQSHDDDDKHLYRYTCGRKDDIYSSVWYRNLIDGNERDGGERYCSPCNQWYNTRNHAWANHMTSVHGISAVTKTIYPFPSGVILGKSNKLKGWCPKCQEFVHLYIKKVGTVWTTWFRHQDAHIRKEMQDRRGGKICTPNNRRNSKKRSFEAVEAVEVEAAEVEKPLPSSSVDVSASNDVINFEFLHKKQRFEIEVYESPAFEPGCIQTDFVEPVQLIGLTSEANYSIGEVQNMMDIIEQEMNINVELARKEETKNEHDIVNDNTEEDTGDSEYSGNTEQEDTEDTCTSPEEDGDFKYNPFEGQFDNYDGLFGDYNF